MWRRAISLLWLLAAAVVLFIGFALFGRPDQVHESVERAGELASAAGDLIADRDADDDDDDEGGANHAAIEDDDDDDRDDDDEATRVVVVDGVPVVFLDDEDRQRVGIETAMLARTEHRAEIVAMASVVDIQPMLAHRGQCLGAVYEVELAQTRLAAAEREYERLRKLNQDDGNVAAKRVQEAEAKVQIDRVSLNQSQAALDTLVNEARQSWGPVLAEWLIGEQVPALTRLVENEDVMLLVVLPRGESLPADVPQAWISSLQDNGDQQLAHFLSRAPYTDRLAQGESYFYRTAADGLRAGMRAEARIATNAVAADGVLIPDSAVVWALGQAWAYLALDDDHFARIPVATDRELADGWFVTDGVAPGERIVVTGAQTLYAEEFRWQVFEEDDD